MYCSGVRSRPRPPRSSPGSRRAACADRGLPRRRARGGRRRARSSRIAISLNAAPSSATSVGPCSGARAERSPSASAPDTARSRSTGSVIDLPTTSAAAIATVEEAAATARMTTSAPMWNIATPDRSTAASGSPTASKARPASRALTLGKSRRTKAPASPAASVEAATMSASSITARGGSRRPRPSRGNADARVRLRSSRAGAARAR